MSGPNSGGTVAVIASTHLHIRLLLIIACRVGLQVGADRKEATDHSST
jgi:hypothetical protein